MIIKALPENLRLFYSNDKPSEMDDSIKGVLQNLQDVGALPEVKLDNNWLAILDLDTKEVVSFIVADKIFTGKMLTAFWTALMYRRQGLVGYLINHLFGFSGKDGSVFIQLPQSRTEVIAFAEGFGFDHVQTTEGVQLWRLMAKDHWRALNIEHTRAEIDGFKEYIYWEPDGDSVTIDGSFDINQLRALVRFMEMGGPGKGGCKHEELKVGKKVGKQDDDI